ncbi:alpha/beta hydrolase [Streptomyces carminius]|uniref:Alpha/beta hydrolase n=1 Tax=Streptomyces carminius TaxID=2665496 RepID=A0A2M8LSH2_9ACTN|nr:alpha/beta hydrolase [Streptomyces carminius]PJE94903.1 alpha/beta hydrolase [Streptomyces carminius]
MVEMTPHTMAAPGTSIHYWTAGPRDGPLVMCTHGLSMDHRMFDAQVGPLTEAGYRVLTWDVQGHGRSKPLPGKFSVTAAAEHLHALMGELGRDRAVLLGHSLGGFVSQELLYRRPEAVRALVVVGNNSLTMPLSASRRILFRLSPLLFLLTSDKWRRKVVSEGTATDPESRRYAYDATSRLCKKEFFRVWAGLSRCMRPDPDYRIPCPALLTRGENDSAGSVKGDFRAWVEREPNGESAVVPDAGHNANQDNPEFFNRRLLEFLSSWVGEGAERPSSDRFG